MPKACWSVHLPRLWAEQSGLCCYCGEWTMMFREARHLPGAVFAKATFTWQGKSYRYATVEHLLPRCQGGSAMRLSNMVMACVTCNNDRDKRRQIDERDELREAG